MPTTADGMGGPGNSGRDGGLNLRTAAAALLPTPIAADGQGGPRALPERRTSSGPDHGPQLRDLAPTLLPTPTATPYGNNQSPSPGAAVRPSLDSLAPMLLATPTARDWKGETAPVGRVRPDGVARTVAQGTLPDQVGALLPTPVVTDARGARNATSGRQQGSQHHTGYTLTDVLVPPPPEKLLPTPLASDAGPRGGTTGFGLRDWSRSIGAPTSQPSDDGSES